MNSNQNENDENIERADTSPPADSAAENAPQTASDPTPETQSAPATPAPSDPVPATETPTGESTAIPATPDATAPAETPAEAPPASPVEPAPPAAAPAPPPALTGADAPNASAPIKQQLESDADLQKEIDEALGDASIEDLMNAPAEADVAAAADEADSANTAATASSAGGQDDEIRMDIRRGRIAKIDGDDVFVELAGVDGKNTGVVPLKQFNRPPRAGAIMDFVVDRFDEKEGLYILSREGAIQSSTWDNLHKGASVEARVTGTNKGGLDLELLGSIKAFMPLSQIDLGRVEDVEKFVGEKLPAVVEEFDRKAKRVVLSRRSYLIKHREANKKKLFAELKEGDLREGTVSSVKPYGAFVDIGGVDGLVHVSDISYEHVNKPEDHVKVGDKVQVRVLKIDHDHQKIGLGMKQVQADPWEGVEGKYKPGEDVSGRVVRTADFGAFIELEQGVEGLLPISEMSWSRVNKASDVVKEGDVIRLRILQVDPKKNRISLSLKQSQGDPWVGAAHTYATGTVVDGKVTSTTDFGAFIEVKSGIEAMVHISELSPRRVGKVTDVLNVGDQKQFKVIQIDEEQRRMKVSLKAVTHPEEARAAEQQIEESKKPRRKPRKADDLAGGMGDHGGMGMGLGDLKL